MLNLKKGYRNILNPLEQFEISEYLSNFSSQYLIINSLGYLYKYKWLLFFMYLNDINTLSAQEVSCSLVEDVIPLNNEPKSNKNLLIAGVIIICLAGAGVMYFLYNPTSPPVDPVVNSLPAEVVEPVLTMFPIDPKIDHFGVWYIFLNEGSGFFP